MKDTNRGPLACAFVVTILATSVMAGTWKSYEKNPVLGNEKLGTCFDVNVVTDGPAPYTMYFSWRPKKAIALVRSEDGFRWAQEPEICLEADKSSGWEEDLNRSCTVKKDGLWHMWYTGQAWNNKKKTMMSRIGYATSTDGVRFTRVRKTPVMVPETDFEKFSVMNPYVRWDEARKAWRMWYAAGETYEPNVLCYAESKDGLTWTKSDRNPIFEHGSPLAWDRARVGACEVHPLADGRWAMFYIGYSDIDTARIGCAISKDGVTGWTRLGQNPIVAPDLGTWNGSACYKPSVARDEKNNRWLLWYNGRNGCPEYVGMAIHEGLDLEAPAVAPSDTAELLKTYVARFNAKDVDLVTNAIPNAEAEAFMLANCPRFACPDRDVERTYYFRWWTFRKHLRKGEKGQWRVSEFLPKVEWAGKDNTIVCPAGHHFREGRWLRDPQYIRDLARFWLSDKEAKHRWNYSSWLYTGVCAFAEVSGEDALTVDLLDDAVSYYEAWEKGFGRWLWDQKPECALRMGGDGKGLFLSSRANEGSEFTLTPSGYRPLFNAAMWSEANAISKVAAKLGRTELAKRFAGKADAIMTGFEKMCWNEKLGFFVSADPKGVQCPVRELHGYAPWYFGMPTAKRPDWAQLADPQGFAATYGLTFPERRAKGFRIAYDAHECLWDGPVWPFATSIALTALANDLHSTPTPTTYTSLFASLLWQYADSQRLTHPSPWTKGEKGDWGVVPWIDENNHPDKPEWLARKIMLDRPGLGAKFPRERGKDYNHSTYCDLVISGLVGFVPHGERGFAIDPLCPSDWDYFTLENLRYCGHDVAVRWQRGKGLSVEVDGKVIAQRGTFGRLAVRLDGMGDDRDSDWCH